MNPRSDPRNTTTDVLALQARGLVKRYGHVTALGGADVELRAGEVLAVIGDNGAGKSTLIKCLSGAEVPDAGEIRLFGEPVRFRNPLDARDHGLETVYQNLAVAPSRDIPANLFLGRERRRPGPLGGVFRLLDKKGMREETRELLTSLGLLTIQNFSQPVETLSGGQRQGVAVARAACFGSRVIIMDEPTAALGVRESRRVLDLIREIRSRGVPVILISHDMPHVFDVADRIHVQRLGRRVALVRTSDISMPDAVALMTGALDPAELDGGSPAGTP
ncbi:sugar ABC transporter ATP-binding protein [Streptomyces sp. PRKS01-29]|nr:ATP-binding cassette domain-containing protein [Streptomyces sabulosicollis]MBI0294935.1 sugar ABC transporter ATP-binding protein [Streptomyces sabulosicollis]